MKALLSKSLGAFKSEPGLPNNFVGEASFIYHKKKMLFAITLDGKVVHQGEEISSLKVPIFMDEYYPEFDSLNNHAWYSMTGNIYMRRNQKSGFFMPSLILGQIDPEVIFVKGTFTMSKEKNKPLFKVDLTEKTIIPLDQECKGLIVFQDYSSLGKFIYGQQYYTEGKIFKPYDYRTGIFEPTSIQEI